VWLVAKDILWYVFVIIKGPSSLLNNFVRQTTRYVVLKICANNYVNTESASHELQISDHIAEGHHMEIAFVSS
jgi:hypothetical protein